MRGEPWAGNEDRAHTGKLDTYENVGPYGFVFHDQDMPL